MAHTFLGPLCLYVYHHRRKRLPCCGSGQKNGWIQAQTQPTCISWPSCSGIQRSDQPRCRKSHHPRHRCPGQLRFPLRHRSAAAAAALAPFVTRFDVLRYLISPVCNKLEVFDSRVAVALCAIYVSPVTQKGRLAASCRVTAMWMDLYAQVG